MSNERIDFSELEDLQESWEERLTEEGIKEALGNWLFDNGNELIAELKRCYKQNDLLTKAFMMAGNNGCYMTMCEECDDVHTPDDECPFVCEHCDEKKCECPASE